MDLTGDEKLDSGLAYEQSGSGDPLVLLHGVGSSRHSWNPVVERLSTERTVVAVDLPGHGDSPPLPEGSSYDVAGYTTAVGHLFIELGLDRPDVAGNSLGGAIALELGTRGAVRSVAALAPIGFWTDRQIRFADGSLRLSRWLARRVDRLAPVLLRPALGRRLLLAQYYGRPARLTTDEAAAALSTLARTDAVNRTLPFTRRYRFAPPLRLDVPVTVAWGARDRLLTPSQADRARQRLPGAHHVRLPGCGHVPMPDDPDLVATVLLEASAHTPGGAGSQPPSAG